MSLVTTPFHNAGIEFKAQYRLGQPENEGHIRRVYPNFVTDYMKNSSLIIVFTHSYYHKMRKDHLTTEIGRSLFATVHGVRYIEWTLHVKKIEREFSIELVRHTNANIKGEFRIQFSAQSKTGKKIQSFSAKWHALEHRVEYVPEYTDKLTELYENDEFNPGLLKIEVKVAFALVDFLYTKPEIEPKLNLMEEENDERIAALTLANDDSHDS
ncbi:unnamed protein product [Thelazia callipaeda]|uniref:MATH domain-containing protein n=1 Tax=Thelazia callipaeda TaxID=103827 RepID=A0A0N5CRF6_THECL|nr:unnamed protein product [Thelazia callipaeda]